MHYHCPTAKCTPEDNEPTVQAILEIQEGLETEQVQLFSLAQNHG